jgi:hypothetical protein
MSVSTDELSFGYIPIGESRERTFQVTNLGPGPYSCGMGDIRDSTFTISPDTLDVAEGESQVFTVTARGLVPGYHATVTEFESPFPDVILRSVSNHGENPVRVGIYFDEGTFEVNQIQTESGEILTAYLVVKGGDFWSINNTFSWDGCLEFSGDNTVLSVDYYSPEDVNGYCGETYLDRPDATGARVAATIMIWVKGSDKTTEFRLVSPEDPIEPGLPNLIVGPQWVFSHAKMALPTETGQPLVAAINTSVSGVGDNDGPGALPAVTRLESAYPNPFNPHTTIAFEIPTPKEVTLRVFDLSGRLVRNLVDREPHAPGRHEIIWNGRDDARRQVASGTYFYRLEAGKFTETRGMLLVK